MEYSPQQPFQISKNGCIRILNWTSFRFTYFLQIAAVLGIRNQDNSC